MENENRQEWLDSLPKKTVATGLYVFDNEGKMLIVKPSYKEGWSVPGGVCEALESPTEAVIREVREEMGLVAEIDRFLALDYLRDEKNDSLQFIYLAKPISEEEKAKIKIDNKEISEYRFVELDEAIGLLRKSHRARLTNMDKSLEGFHFLENGEIVNFHK